METQKPKWIAEARKMISGCDGRAKNYWNGLGYDERRYLCTLAGLKKGHLELTWDELKDSDKVYLWRGILQLRRMQQDTRNFTPEDFKGVVDYSLSRRAVELAERAEQFAKQVKEDVSNSMH